MRRGSVQKSKSIRSNYQIGKWAGRLWSCIREEKTSKSPVKIDKNKTQHLWNKKGGRPTNWQRSPRRHTGWTNSARNNVCRWRSNKCKRTSSKRYDTTKSRQNSKNSLATKDFSVFSDAFSLECESNRFRVESADHHHYGCIVHSCTTTTATSSSSPSSTSSSSSSLSLAPLITSFSAVAHFVHCEQSRALS